MGAILIWVVLASGAAAQQVILAGGEPMASAGQGLVTREWIWSTGPAITTFTARGPADQVDRIDPHDRSPFCEGCELASSTQFEPGSETVSD